MAYAIAAELQVVLEGVPLPASKQELFAYAQSQGADQRLLAALRSVPDREYGFIDEVGEELASVQPPWEQPQPQTPSGDSDAVPGGPDYTRVPSDTGQVRDVEQGVEQQSELG
jgi:hypothetical protein